MNKEAAALVIHSNQTFSYRWQGHWTYEVQSMPQEIFLKLPADFRRKLIYLGCRLGRDVFVKRND